LQLKQLMVLEILAIAVANYFTSAPELIRPTHLQISQVKNILNMMHQNFLVGVELIISKLPNEIMQNVWANQLQNILKSKRQSAKRGPSQKKGSQGALQVNGN
jgi:hypothetical protein